MRQRLLLGLCAAIAWCCGTFFALTAQQEDPLLEQDEVYWIGSAYYYHLALVQRDWNHEAWRWLPARENPPVSKYVIGLGLALSGQHIESIDSLSYFYFKWLRWDTQPSAPPTTPAGEKRAEVVRAAGPNFQTDIVAKRRAPLPRRVVQAARNTILVCAALGSLGLLLLGWAAGSGFAGLVASQLLLWHPVEVSAASHAMSDTIAQMFAIFAAGATFWWYRRQVRAPEASFGSGLPASFLTGTALALACGAKMNSLVLILLAGAMTLLLAATAWNRGDRAAARRAVGHGLVVLATALGVFIIINPAILIDFPGGLFATMGEHRQTESVQMDLRYPHPVGLWGRFDAVVTMAFFGWPGFVLVLGVVGWSVLRRWRDPGVRVAVCWWILALAGLTQWLPFAWPRYVVPVLPPTLWLIAGAIAAAATHVVERARARPLA